MNNAFAIFLLWQELTHSHSNLRNSFLTHILSSYLGEENENLPPKFGYSGIQEIANTEKEGN